jgi:hypothetical protein
MKKSKLPIDSIPFPVSILMPVSNEADVIEFVIEEWISDVFRFLPKGSEFIFDEAGSNDGTNEILHKLSLKYSFIKVFHRKKKDGFGNAAKRLFSRASCPLVFFSDSDGQYLPSDFWKIAKFCNDNYDLIRGAKIGRKDPFIRRLSSAFFGKFIQFLFNTSYLDYNSGFFLIKRDVLSNLLPLLRSMPTLVNTELLLRAELENYSIKQVYVLHRRRKYGTSRGLNPSTYFLHALFAINGLYKIKASYRI